MNVETETRKQRFWWWFFRLLLICVGAVVLSVTLTVGVTHVGSNPNGLYSQWISKHFQGLQGNLEKIRQKMKEKWTQLRS